MEKTDISEIGNHLAFVEGEIKSLATVCDNTLKRQIRLGVRVEVLEEMEKTEGENRIVEMEHHIGWLKVVFEEKMCLLKDIHARLRVLESRFFVLENHLLDEPNAESIESKALTDELFPQMKETEEPEEYRVREEALAGIATETVFDGDEV